MANIDDLVGNELAKPVAKGALKAGVMAFERGRETLAELGEVVEDIVAETQAELREERQTAEQVVVEESEGGAVAVVDVASAKPANEDAAA